jgi:hypothetical protein
MICRICGKKKEDHHEFEPLMPKGCVCDPRTWGGEVNKICDQFVGDKQHECKVCEHNYECHAEFYSS